MTLYMPHYAINSPIGVIADTHGLLRDAAFILLQGGRYGELNAAFAARFSICFNRY